jgi:hypothetical protein
MKTFARLFAITAVALSTVSPASAHFTPENRHPHPPANARITEPANGSTVGPRFTITGTLNEGCTVSDIAYGDGHGGSVLSREEGTVKNIQTSGSTFRAEVDFTKPIGRGMGGEADYVEPGKISVSAWSNDCEGPDPNNATIAEVYVTYRAEAPAGNQQRVVQQPTPTTTPTPVATASVSPDESADVAGAEGDVDRPLWWVLLGIVLGVAFLGVAEWTAHRYRAKHPKA